MQNETIKNNDSATCGTANVSGCCKCLDCGKQFDEYNFTEDCWMCQGEGEVEKEMEWEYEPSMYRCSTCKGKGLVTYLENKRCRNCKINYVYYDDYEDETDDYYCDHCGRTCNCH